MAEERQAAAAERLALVAERIERWRRTRGKQRPMPAPLWDEAVSLAQQLGVHPVKAALGLNYESLKQRLALSRPVKPEPSGAAASFVELSGVQWLGAASSAGDAVELSDTAGSRLTVRLAAGSTLDVARLVEAFRRRQG
jgi:hypothetical protein